MRKISFVLILVVVLGCGVVGLACERHGGCNKKSVSSQSEDSQSNAEVVDSEKNRLESENIALKQTNELQKNNICSLNSAMTCIVAMVGILAVAISYVVFKNNKEYNKIRQEAQDALKVTRDTAREAEEELGKIKKRGEAVITEIAEKGNDEFNKIRERGEDELNKIREQGKDVKDEVAKEAEKERKVSELWSEALRDIGSKEHAEAAAKFEKITVINPNDYAAYYNHGSALVRISDLKGGDEDILKEAIGKLQKAIGIKPDDYMAYNNWGVALRRISDIKGGDEGLLKEAIGKLQKTIEIQPDYDKAYSNWGEMLMRISDIRHGDEGLLKEAISKFKKAIVIEPDYHDAISDYGLALLKLSALKDGDKDLLEEAEEKLLKAEDIKRGSGAYNLACVVCLLDDEEGCKKWLEVVEEEGELPTREDAMGDDDLAKVRDEDWFKELKWKVKK